jgi:hypothetical protein
MPSKNHVNVNNGNQDTIFSIDSSLSKEEPLSHNVEILMLRSEDFTRKAPSLRCVGTSL